MSTVFPTILNAIVRGAGSTAAGVLDPPPCLSLGFRVPTSDAVVGALVWSIETSHVYSGSARLISSRTCGQTKRSLSMLFDDGQLPQHGIALRLGFPLLAQHRREAGRVLDLLLLFDGQRARPLRLADRERADDPPPKPQCRPPRRSGMDP